MSRARWQKSSGLCAAGCARDFAIPAVHTSSSSLNRFWLNPDPHRKCAPRRGSRQQWEGNLWVANDFGDTLVQFTKEQLASSGSFTPNARIASNAGSLDLPSDLRFDANDNLWGTNANFLGSGVSTIFEFTASQLTGSGNPAPKVIITEALKQLPFALTFDANGDLWVANCENVFGPGGNL